MSDHRPVVNIAHRGASAYAPENTFAAFDLALAMAADGLETDLRLTADGCVVLMHDETVDRTTDGKGKLANLTLAQVRALDAGSWFSPEFAGERVPTLVEFLAAFGGCVPLVLEVKDAGCVELALREVLARGYLYTVTFTAFAIEPLERILALEPSARTGYLVMEANSALMRELVGKGVTQVCPRANVITPEMVKAAHAAGLEVRAWGVRDEELMLRVLDAGADGMTVNWPDILRAELMRRDTI